MPGERDVTLNTLGLLAHVVVPIEAEPCQAVEDGVDRLLGRACPVGVFNAQAEPTAVTARIQPVEQRRAGAADVKKARRRGGESCNDVSHFGDVSGLVRCAADVAQIGARREPALPDAGRRAKVAGGGVTLKRRGR